MAICFYLLQNYPKSVEKATESINMKPTIKGYYRRGKAYVLLKNYTKAVEDFEEAVKLDTTDPNDI
jgi:tetratricopeptide (TPR) repeat protein